MLKDVAVELREEVETSGEHTLNRVRKRQVRKLAAALPLWSDAPGCTSGAGLAITNEDATVGEHADNLLDKEGIALALPQDTLAQPLRYTSPWQQLAHELLCIRGGERLQAQHHIVALTPTPIRPLLQEVRPCGAEQKQWHICGALGNKFKQLQQHVVSPVNVVHHEEQRTLYRQRLEKEAPGAEQSLLQLLTICREQRSTPCGSFDADGIAEKGSQHLGILGASGGVEGRADGCEQLCTGSGWCLEHRKACK